ncbi:hypothetical protein BS78_10G238400 [Paspalum vaginatum]|nr:hypothetical protein BS78_10G238400 [Paspalum vaginatum]
MLLFQFLATWLLPGAVYAAAAEVAVASEHDRTSSSSATFSVKGAQSGSSLSSPSSSSSSSSGDRPPRFSPSRKQSPSLCFGAGGAGRLLWGGARARAPAKQDDDVAAAASTAPKGDAVGKYLRRISRRLRKARSAGKASPSASPSPRGADDDTARERADSVARAIAYCKDTLWRGAAPPTPPSPSLDDWLHDRQGEIIAGAEARGNERRDSQRMESSCLATSPSRDDECRGESSSPSDLAAGGSLEMLSSFDEMEFLKIFDGDEEMMDHHFITIQI